MSDRPQTLAEYLGTPLLGPEAATLEEIADPKEFGLAVMNSIEFRRYILLGLTLGTLPGFTGILKFFLEHAVGKTPDRVELTGKDGGPIRAVTEVRRVIVRPSEETRRRSQDEEEEARKRSPYTTH